MEPVGGLVAPRTFFAALARGVFLSTQYVRHHSQPFYTPEPDVIHELVGHAATLAHPRIAELNRRIAETSQKLANLDKQIEARARALPLYAETLATEGLIPVLRGQRDHPVHTLLRRMYFEKRS